MTPLKLHQKVPSQTGAPDLQGHGVHNRLANVCLAVGRLAVVVEKSRVSFGEVRRASDSGDKRHRDNAEIDRKMAQLAPSFPSGRALIFFKLQVSCCLLFSSQKKDNTRPQISSLCPGQLC